VETRKWYCDICNKECEPEELRRVCLLLSDITPKPPNKKLFNPINISDICIECLNKIGIKQILREYKGSPFSEVWHVPKLKELFNLRLQVSGAGLTDRSQR